MSAKTKWLYLFVLALIWGSSFILIALGLVGLNPFQLGSLRIVFSGIFLLATGFRSLPKIPRHQWKFIALTALFGTFIPAYFFPIAEMQISSSVSAILNSLTPLNTLILGSALFGLVVKRTQVIGVTVGLVGTAILIFSGAIDHPGQDYRFAGFVIVATLCYATNVNLVKKYLSDLSPLAITTGNFVVMLVPAIAILCCSDFFHIVHEAKVQRSIYFVMILGIMGTVVANILFYKLIQMSTPVFATQVTYLIPIVACGWGFLYHETLTPIQIFGAFVILVGVYLSGKK